jgi:hypothetical protein
MKFNRYNNTVSVIVPCYNHAKYLPEALESISKQSYEDLECIIVNDGSVDNTEEIGLNWSRKDKRFKYFKITNSGLSSARNIGLNKMKGKYVQFLDADDSIDKDKLKIGLEIIGDVQNAIAINDFMIYEEAEKKHYLPIWRNYENIDISFQTLLLEWDISYTIPIHCGLFPSLFFDKIRFDENLRAKEDWIMWLKVFKKYNPTICYIKKSLAIYRYSPSSMSNNIPYMYENIYLAFEKVYSDFVDDNNKEAFVKKINKYWYNELKKINQRNIKLVSSRSYKFASEIGRKVRNLKELANRLKP